MALAQYHDKYWFPNGAPAAGVTARVFPNGSNELAVLYTDATGTTPMPNPARTDANGFLTFWAEEGTYWVHIDTESIQVTVGGSAQAATEGYVDAAVAAHSAGTLNVHGIADTSQLETVSGAQEKADQAADSVLDMLDAHASDPYDVHGIADTRELETKTGAQVRADSAQAAAEATASAALQAHSADTLGVHGIADTAALETKSGAQAKADAARDEAIAASTGVSEEQFTAHTSATTSVHGIADTALLETVSGAQEKANTAQTNAVNEAASALAAHEADTLGVHGIADTAALETKSGAQAKADIAEADAIAMAEAALNTHEADTQGVHGIADTRELETKTGAQVRADSAQAAAEATASTALQAHSANTLDVHGIADTAALVTQDGADGRYVLQSLLGAAGGVATLDPAGLVDLDQLRLFTINVRDYGAVGDGVADDAPAIQAALNYAALAGGWVVVPPGDYRLATLPLRIYDFTRLTLLPGATFIRAAAFTLLINGDADQLLGGYTGRSNILIEGGLWDLRGAEVTDYNTGIALGHGQNITVRDLTIKDTAGYHAIEINSCKTVRVERCRFLGLYETGDRSFTEAVQLDLAKGSRFFGGFGPYDHTPCQDVTISGCYFGASGTPGTTAWARGIGSHAATKTVWHSQVKITECTFEGLIQYAVSAYNWNQLTFTENDVLDCGAGVMVFPIDTDDTNDTLDPDGNQTGTAQDMQGFAISDNIFVNIGEVNEPILCAGVPTGKIRLVTITGNTISGVRGSHFGIRLDYTEQYTIADNVMEDVGGTCISQHNVAGGVVSDNRLIDSAYSGISCDAGTDVKIQSNTIYDVDVNGVHVVGGKDVDVIDNTIKGASRASHAASYGIRVSSGCDGLRMVGNKVRLRGSGNEVAWGAAITSTCANVTRYGNDLAGVNGPLQDNTTGPRVTPWDQLVTVAPVLAPASYQTVANTTAETVVATLPIPAGDPVAGAVYRLQAKLRVSTTGTPTYTLRLRLGGLGGPVLLTHGPTTTAADIANKAVSAEAEVVCLSAGASGTCTAHFRHVRTTTTVFSSIAEVLEAISSSTSAWNTTAATDLVLTWEWGTAAAGNSAVRQNVVAGRLA